VSPSNARNIDFPNEIKKCGVGIPVGSIDENIALLSLCRFCCAGKVDDLMFFYAVRREADPIREDYRCALIIGELAEVKWDSRCQKLSAAAAGISALRMLQADIRNIPIVQIKPNSHAYSGYALKGFFNGWILGPFIS
jgi:hypothetical protein